MNKTSFIGAILTLIPGEILIKSIIESHDSELEFNPILRQTKEPYEIPGEVLFCGSRLFIPQRKIGEK